MLNLGSISEPNQFILSLSYESNDNKKEISFLMWLCIGENS